MKLAAIDIGSNSIHMIVAGTRDNHSFEILDREKEMVFLGKSVFDHGRLTDEAIASGLGAIAKFHKLALRHGVTDIRAVATAAVREADNGGEFLYSIAEHTGIVPQVISGAEEARFIYLSVRNAIDLANRSALIIDIGGGSVETIVGDARSMWLGRSLKLGVQRLRAQFGGGAALGKREKKDLDDHVRQLAEQALTEARAAQFELVIGTSGTILALGQAAHRLKGGEPWTNGTGQIVRLDDLKDLSERLTAASPAERALIGGIEAKRADSIHVGAVLLCNLLELAKQDRITLCEAALREGLVLDYLDSRADSIRQFDVVKDIRRHSVMELARRCGQSGPHPEHVATLALSLFDQTRHLHRLGDDERRLLEYASILHDVGQLIGYERHEHHAAYIIRNGELRGFTDDERELIALIARYHRKARPRRRDLDYAALTTRWRQAVRVLSGILRLADGLDRSHHQLVSAVTVEELAGKLRVSVTHQGDAELEVWGARRKGRLLERELGKPLELCLASTAHKVASA
ncbi:MAG: Ppx/GppA family phosphatase [Myxococcales bacterium]|nr:Ppx/GppA family phosphatase [Myxococcales bacterium]